MKAYPLITISLQTHSRQQMIDITRRITEAIAAHGLRDGIAVIHVPHTTAAVTINENADPDVQQDLLGKLAYLIPQRESYYRHNEGNSDSHLKSTLVSCSQTLIVERGELVLGTWQGVYFCEFDGPRQRQFFIKAIGE